MALTNTQTSFSDIFASRSADSRVSSSSRRRIESASSGDFGAMFASVSAKPEPKATSKSEHAERGASRRDSVKSSTVNPSTVKPSTAKESSSSQMSKRDGADRLVHNQPKSNTDNIEGKAAIAMSATEKISSTVRNEMLAMESIGAGGLNPANGSSIKFQTGSASMVSNAELLSQLNSASLGVGPFAEEVSITSPALEIPIVDGSEEITAKTFGQDANSDSVKGFVVGKSLEMSVAAPNEQKSIGQLTSLTGGTELKSIEELIRNFEAKPIVDNGASSESKLGADNLKALEQLNSVKLVAPTVVRSLMSQKSVRGEAGPKSAVVASQASAGAIQTSGMVASNAIELANATPQNTTLSKEFFALQQGGLDEGIRLDGKGASLEAAIQLQAEGANGRDTSETKNIKTIGKLVVPEKFGAMLKSGVQSLRLQIAPKHLGTAELTVKLIRDHVQGTLTVTSESAKVAALNSIESLADRLSSEGLVLDSLDVEVSQDGFNQGRNELESQYSEVLQGGLIQRAFERSDDFSQAASVSHIIEPTALNIVNAANVDTHA